VNLSREKLLSLYFQMLRIRKVELRIESLYHLDEMKTPIRRVASPDVPTPAGYTLEEAFYTGMPEIITAARELVEWKG
jgi:pyruvate/2-oxoglutarate/acetoin dehydrogenase E1 component